VLTTLVMFIAISVHSKCKNLNFTLFVQVSEVTQQHSYSRCSKCHPTRWLILMSHESTFMLPSCVQNEPWHIVAVLHQCVICCRSIRPNFKLIPTSAETKLGSQNNRQVCFLQKLKFGKKIDKDIARIKLTVSAVKNTTKIAIKILQGSPVTQKSVKRVSYKLFANFL